MRKLLSRLFRRRKSVGQFQNRNIRRAKLLYWYIIVSGISGATYSVVSLFIESLSPWYGLTPVVLFLFIVFSVFFKKTIFTIWMGLKDIDRGRLLMYLNSNTHFSEQHKLELIKWVYPSKKEVRQERRGKISEKMHNKDVLSEKDKKDLRKKIVRCPHQVRDGVNEAILVAALIFAHINIAYLDDDLREIMKLSDENIDKFDLQTEIDRCKTKEAREKYDKLIETGINRVKQANGQS